MNIPRILATSAIPFLFMCVSANAQSVPLAISYQAILTDDAGDPLSPATPTNYPLVFRIFDSVEDGELLWSESQNVSVFQGSFSTLLGTGDEVTGEARPQLDTIFDDAQRYLEITITDGGVDKTFTPRQRMVSAPFAFRSRVSELALTVADSVVSTAQVAGGAITNEKMASNSVSSSNIQASAVGASQIADNAVGTSEIANSAVTLNELATIVINRLQPAGSVTAWAGVPTARTVATGETLSGVPQGWLLCDGKFVTRSAYPALFSALGYIYGGSGNIFRLPDYRGYFLRGQASSTSQDPDRNSRGHSSGNASTNGLLEGSTQSDQFRSHNHSWSFWDTNDGGGDYQAEWDTSGGRQRVQTINTTHNGGHETRPKNRYVWYIIKAH